MSNLFDIYSNPSIEHFGKALRIALAINEDYASLVELDYAEKDEEFALALKKFLRRLDASSRRYEREILENILSSPMSKIWMKLSNWRKSSALGSCAPQ